MYMRLIQVRIKREKWGEMEQLYKEKVIPALHGVPGCLFAGLIRSENDPDECISMMLWSQQTHAEAYVQSPVFTGLFQEASRYFADSSEWKIELTKELKLEYVPVPHEPLVKSYAIAVQNHNMLKSNVQSQFMHVRIVAPHVRPAMLDEFKRIYTQEVLPALRAVRGCRYAFLTEGTQIQSEVLSVTIWDSQQDAAAYEASGQFVQLQEKLKHTFSELYQWKMGLEKNVQRKSVTTDDPNVEHYQVVRGEIFKQLEGQ